MAAQASCMTKACRTICAPLTVGRHKRTEENETVRQDGFISAILILVFIVGASIATVISQYLSEERVKSEENIPAFVAQIFLLLLLIPGFVTIAYAFKERRKTQIVTHADLNLLQIHRSIETYFLYIFAGCSIVFDLFSVACEFNCLSALSAIDKADRGIDIVFYLVKVLFTLSQCLFIRKFHNSRFDTTPFLQVSLVSIIAANMAIWIYTTIEEDANQLFGKKYDTRDLAVDMNDTACNDPDLQHIRNQLQPYFTPFTLEFALLVFEKIVHMWVAMTDLDLVPLITRNRARDAFLDNRELHRIQHDLHQKHDAHKKLRHELSTSQARIWTWMMDLYTRVPTPHLEYIIRENYKYAELLQGTIESINEAMDGESFVLKRVEGLQKMNGLNGRFENVQLQPNPQVSLQRVINSHNNNLLSRRENIQNSIESKVEEVNTIDSKINISRNTIRLARSALPNDHESGYRCGLGVTVGLFAGIILCAIALALVVVGSDHQISFRNITTSNCSADHQKRLHATGISDFNTYSTIIDVVALTFNISAIAMTFYGFKALLTFQSNYQHFVFTDIFYCLSCIGSVILLSFSAIATFAIKSDTTVIDWKLQNTSSSMEDSVRVLDKREYCAGDAIYAAAVVSMLYITSQLVQVFLSSAFLIHAKYMLPHGISRRNKPVSEAIQFIGIAHFFLWIANSFLYSPNLAAFYFVEQFYYGATFDVIARLTFPLLIFYHFTTVMRCIGLNDRYLGNP